MKYWLVTLPISNIKRLQKTMIRFLVLTRVDDNHGSICDQSFVASVKNKLNRQVVIHYDKGQYSIFWTIDWVCGG